MNKFMMRLQVSRKLLVATFFLSLICLSGYKVLVVDTTATVDCKRCFYTSN